MKNQEEVKIGCKIENSITLYRNLTSIRLFSESLLDFYYQQNLLDE